MVSQQKEENNLVSTAASQIDVRNSVSFVIERRCTMQFPRTKQMSEFDGINAQHKDIQPMHELKQPGHYERNISQSSSKQILGSSDDVSRKMMANYHRSGLTKLRKALVPRAPNSLPRLLPLILGKLPTSL